MASPITTEDEWSLITDGTGRLNLINSNPVDLKKETENEVEIDPENEPYDDKGKWSMITDGDGKLHLINLNPYDMDMYDESTERKFRPERDVSFALYTKKNPRNPQYIKLNDKPSLDISNFDPSEPTRFVVHGWFSSEESGFNTRIHTEYMIKGAFNVFVVDWSKGSETLNYIGARNRVEPVGQVISKFIDFLKEHTALDNNDIYIVGHSLGAHIAGNAGRAQGGTINTIFGLDPAYPLFSKSSKDRIYSTDGQYVEIMHTNAKTLGFDIPLGTADFYPNGGKSQRGCPILDLTGTCDHLRAYKYFAESITTTRSFMATQCQDYKGVLSGKCKVTGKFANMAGEPSNFGKEVTGIHYLQTNKKSPYANGPAQ